MHAKIIDNEWIYLDNIIGFEEHIINHFSMVHPGRRYISSYQNDRWDGIIRKYSTRYQRLKLPFLSELVELCQRMDVPLDIIDLRDQQESVPDPEIVDENWLHGIKLEQYQIDAIKSACAHDIGIHHHITGSGKTEVVAGIIKLFAVPTIVVADQRIIIEQIKERLELRDVVDEVGLFYGGETPSGQLVIVGSIQSITSPPTSLKKHGFSAYKKRAERARHFQKLAGRCDLLIADEVDKTSTDAYSKLFWKYFKGRRRYGFSGTPFDESKPVEGFTLRENFGPIISQSTRKQVEDIGRIIPIKFYMIVRGENGDRKDKTMFDVAEREQMIDNTSFHKQVSSIVSEFAGERNLILVDTSNIEDLGKALEKEIPGSIFIYGKTTKPKRKKILTLFEEGKLPCLIGGKILKRGLDVKGGVDNLILCGGGNLWSDYDQKIGRAVRINERGWARVFGFMFLNNFYLYKHSREHLKAVVHMGYDTKVIYPDMIVDGAKLIKSRFRKPKN